jgi:hypothetical protein
LINDFWHGGLISRQNSNIDLDRDEENAKAFKGREKE